MLPKILHIVWVGDESKRPDHCIASWRENNPGWTVKLWDNEALAETAWLNERHMRMFADAGSWNGVAHLMRWEILYREGGIAVDAECRCLRPLDESLLEHDCFACWQNEHTQPGLVSTKAVGASPGNWFLQRIVLDIQRDAIAGRPPNQSVGSTRLTEAYRKYKYTDLAILPSHLFIRKRGVAQIVRVDEPIPGLGDIAWKPANPVWTVTVLKKTAETMRVK